VSAAPLIAVIGASGRIGAPLCRALRAGRRRYVPVVRNAANWIATGITNEASFADLENPQALARALSGAEVVVSLAPAIHTAAVLAAAPQAARFVLLGCARRHARLPDAAGEGARAGEAAFLAAGRPGVMLHTTPPYGAQDGVAERQLAAQLRGLPLLPLPEGGAAMVQPIHVDDLVACILAALDNLWTGPEAFVVAGPEPMPQRDYLRALSRAAGFGMPRILGLPTALLMRAAPLTRLPLLPRIEAEAIARMAEGMAFDTGPMRARLGVTGRPLALGLGEIFAHN
jgi:nucleoside-diphosphate-sugar epimerase